MKNKKTVAVYSGGLDSTTMIYDARARGYEVVKAVSFNYGQRHKKELDFAQNMCKDLNIPHVIIDLWASGLTDALSSSETSLLSTSETDVPEGNYAEENMKSTVVPNRNMIMISIAGAIAVAEKAGSVMLGVHAGDHFVYPDCRPGFATFAAAALYFGNEDFGELDKFPDNLLTPYIDHTKEDIAYNAFTLGVPIDCTWSCYKGGLKHCGRCGTCVERLEAIHGAQQRLRKEGNFFTDYTMYVDIEFWKTVTK